ncbi:hypothetical protein [Celerinatantimonas sp. MCCC 1A17872]|uniref:hypothetical protein n=1 Tax=Celerinatantimonas sp. MCCC 1A17872 TaxID=3177514 RepID=UPI0038C1028D
MSSTKKELIAQIEALETALDNAGVTYDQVDTTQTNAELEEAIAGLEAILPADAGTAQSTATTAAQSTANTASQTATDKTSASVSATAQTRSVRVHAGVNVELRINGQAVVLKGGDDVHTIPANKAQALVAEKLGVYTDE